MDPTPGQVRNADNIHGLAEVCRSVWDCVKKSFVDCDLRPLDCENYFLDEEEEEATASGEGEDGDEEKTKETEPFAR